jgi:hypothetical protein
MPADGKVDKRIPSAWTTSGLLLLKTKTSFSCPGKERISWDCMMYCCCAKNDGVAACAIMTEESRGSINPKIYKF